MDRNRENRFQDFFEEGKYVVFKNHLYNYTLRKRAIEKILLREDAPYVLEIGSGISPVMTKTDRIVYSELSFLALRTLKRRHGRGSYVVADGTRLPFKDGAFSHAVSSEVLEHVPEDQKALEELSRALKKGGHLIVTFPHRKFYYMSDDRFVEHCRRYELHEMVGQLEAVRCNPVLIEKILGPLEKVTMLTVISTIRFLQYLGLTSSEPGGSPPVWASIVEPVFKWANRGYACVAWLDGKFWPRSLSTVLLIEAEKQ